MAKIQPLDLSELRHSVAEPARISRAELSSELAQHKGLVVVGKRTLTSENMQNILSGGGGYGGFAAAKMTRITADWSSQPRSADQDLVVDMRRLRARARQQAINSPLISKFLGMVRNNVIGVHGIKLAFKVKAKRKSKQRAFDDEVNDKLRTAWRKWQKKQFCTITGKLSWRSLQRQIIESLARDGEVFLKKNIVPKSVNPFGFTLQVLDPDQIDDTYNQISTPGMPQIRMGVEVDIFQKPIAYHVFKGNPYETSYGAADRVRVPADQMIHFYIQHRPGQTRGYPLFAPSMWDLKMLDGYFEAELTAARIHSSLLASIESDVNPDFEGDGVNADGSQAVDIGYGSMLTLGPGQHLNNQTPQHPSAAFPDFVKQSSRYIASGCNVAYHKLCNDLAGINYSSGRLGELEERDYWMELQQEMIDTVLEPVYEEWLRFAMLNGAVDLPLDQIENYIGEAVKWEPRRWPWVDPLKDVQASELAIQNGLSTHRRILSQNGMDLEEVYAELADEQELADELGLQLGTDIRGQATSEINDGPPDNEEEPGNNDNAKPAKPAGVPKPSQAKPSPVTKPTAKKKRRDATRWAAPYRSADDVTTQQLLF